MEPVKPTALALVSGGLDSTLAVRVLLEQGVPLKALHFVSAFSPGKSSAGGLAARRTMERLGVDLIVKDAMEDMLRFVPEPRFGWGKHLNPCLDCRAHHLSVAKTMLEDGGASYVVTGEVLGQRPMSQHRDAMARVERAAGLDGLILRPLSALNLEASIPEQRGWVDRAGLLGISGRSRSEQNVLVKKWGLSGFNAPAGGCLLTDPQFAWKLEDLLNYEGISAGDVHLLKYGRHFRLDARTRVIVGRDEMENAKIVSFRRGGDWLLVASAGSSPETLLRGDASDGHLALAARLTARYCSERHQRDVEILALPARATFSSRPTCGEDGGERRMTVRPASEDDIARLAIRRDDKKAGRK
jgi:tRNA-specific 2-thiouridylase